MRKNRQLVTSLGKYVCTIFICISIASAQDGTALSEQELDSLITSMQDAYAAVDDYTCVFYKQERIDGEMRPMETIRMKFRKPFELYMKWIEDPYEGRELLYKRGWNNGEVRVKQHSFPYLTVNVDPTGTLAMRGNRHPVTEAGIGHTVQIVADDYERSIAHPEEKVLYLDRGDSTMYGEQVRCIEAVTPKNESSNYYAHRALVYISYRTHLPLRVKIWNTGDILVEDYGYADFKINSGLTNRDFEPSNPDYNF
ncbi:MAG: DUF1571 domain-containing protein [Candidatus Marinimicrobia bacterium]|nr:DUF1571 domain-containing protein [Candidatus Neomarinimicrobiota bacterium]MCF7829157.1 DUF1571 domain-containing protein [Candidatus Neomarinimicrobiota bacterium]MCF7881190.1 DUF1571 domain-containing protein [Candidatus Neomarinimicrobiota bacterium]